MKPNQGRQYQIPNVAMAALAIAGTALIVSGLSDLSTANEHQDLSATAVIQPAHQNSPSVNLSGNHSTVDSEVAWNAQWQQQKAEDSDNHNDDELAGEQLSGDLDSVATLSAHFEETSAELIDFDGVVDLINHSDSAFDYIADQYLSIDHESAKFRVLLNALNNTSNPAIVDLALRLVNSSEPALRQQAYSWLRYRSPGQSGIAHQGLVDASYHEHDPAALAQLVSLIPFQEFSASPDLFDRAVYRLNELAFHPDERVSSEAIEQLSSSVKDQSTLSILHFHLHDNSENRQRAALEGLRDFGLPNQEVMRSLNAILHDPNVPHKNRATAARMLIDFENQLNPPENL